MRELSTREQVAKILTVATGESWGDGEKVTDVIDGYAEPGYGPRDSIIVLGNWNPARFPRGEDAPLTKDENLLPRLGDLLDGIDGVEIQWLDEWATCGECYRAVRTEPDSYSWKPSYAWVNECEIVCAECLRADILTALDEGNYVNNADMAITWATSRDLIGAGFTQWEPGNEHTYESGWHPGQDDNPADILAEILREDEDAEVVFLLDATGQFDIRFSAWTRDKDDEGTDDE